MYLYIYIYICIVGIGRRRRMRNKTAEDVSCHDRVGTSSHSVGMSLPQALPPTVFLAGSGVVDYRHLII